MLAPARGLRGVLRAIPRSQTETIMCSKLLALMLVLASALSGCNTIQGAGKDIERGGEKLQDAAEQAKK
jgi:entericidin B